MTSRPEYSQDVILLYPYPDTDTNTEESSGTALIPLSNTLFSLNAKMLSATGEWTRPWGPFPISNCALVRWTSSFRPVKQRNCAWKGDGDRHCNASLHALVWLIHRIAYVSQNPLNWGAHLLHLSHLGCVQTTDNKINDPQFYYKFTKIHTQNSQELNFRVTQES